MSGPESKLWGHVKGRIQRAAKARGLPLYLRRVENPLNQGHPDVEVILDGKHSTIELKVLEAWPKRSDTPVSIAHYTQQQKDDLRERIMAGGRCFFLLWVRDADEYLLFSGYNGLAPGNRVPVYILRMLADCCWDDKVNGKELVEELLA